MAFSFAAISTFSQQEHRDCEDSDESGGGEEDFPPADLFVAQRDHDQEEKRCSERGEERNSDAFQRRSGQGKARLDHEFILPWFGFFIVRQA